MLGDIIEEVNRVVQLQVEEEMRNVSSGNIGQIVLWPH